MGIMLLVFSVIEDSFGHAIAIASFAATTVSVFLSSTVRANQPIPIAICYMSAAMVGFLVSLLSVALYIQAAVALFTLVFLFLILDIMHPPAVAYSFGFLLGGYGLLEVVLTIPALFVYFITLGVVIVVVEQLAIWFGLLANEEMKTKPKNRYEWFEHTVHRLVPLALIVLFVSIMVEFLYPELVAPYSVYLRLLDIGILCLFVIDLGFIYRRTQSISQFVRQNWIDIFATIPFFVVLRLFQGVVVTMAVIARGSIEIGADAARFSRFARPVARTPRFARLLDRLDEVGL